MQETYEMWVQEALGQEAFLGGSDGKEFACNAGDPGSVPGWGQSCGEGNSDSL